MTVSIAHVLERLGIQAKKRGKEWYALCPNPEHEDHHPSWRVRDEPGSPKHGYHKCHACGLGGGLSDLVQTVLDVDWREAKKWLEGESEAAPKKPLPTEVRIVAPRIRRFVLPTGVILAPLAKWPKPPREYAEGRHIGAWQVDRWGLGHAVDGPLAGRIVFPYRGRDGTVRGFTARTYVGHPKRYKEAAARDGADLSAMFGEQHWPAERWRVFVTEGAINALAVERVIDVRSVSREGDKFEFYDAVAAIAGSGLRPGHAVKLSTFAEVVVLTDPDEAGDKAAREIVAGLGRHSKIIRVRLPAGKDAADLSPSDLRRCLDAVVPSPT